MQHGGRYLYEKGGRCGARRTLWNYHHLVHRARRRSQLELVRDDLAHYIRRTQLNMGYRCAACDESQAQQMEQRPSWAKRRP